MHQKEADLKPKSPAQGTSFLVSTTKEQTLSTWEELTMRAAATGDQHHFTPIRSSREDWGASLGSGGSKSMLKFSQAGTRDSLFQKATRCTGQHNQSCSKGIPTFPVPLHALGHSLEQVTKSLTEVQPHAYLGWPSLIDTKLPCLAVQLDQILLWSS